MNIYIQEPESPDAIQWIDLSNVNAGNYLGIVAKAQADLGGPERNWFRMTFVGKTWLAVEVWRGRRPLNEGNPPTIEDCPSP